MVFTNSRNINRDQNLTLNGVRIEYTESERFLGVLMDSNLSWARHINLLAAKISRNMGIIYKLRGKVPQSIKKIYKTVLCSRTWTIVRRCGV